MRLGCADEWNALDPDKLAVVGRLLRNILGFVTSCLDAGPFFGTSPNGTMCRMISD